MKYNFKSYTFWLGIISAILMIIKNLFKINFNFEYANEIVTTILGALVVAGIINSPNASHEISNEENKNNIQTEEKDKKNNNIIIKSEDKNKNDN